ncbi:hypothetical protein QQ045_032499 [Rhodiola kirilowii]
MERLHPACLESRELWTADVPLICFNIVEWHHPIRVMRQFGWKQMIPPAIIAFTNEHHGLERKKKVDWRMHLHQYVALWSSRYERLIYGDPDEDGENIDIPSDEYVYWYSRITRRLIQPKLEEDDTQAYRHSAHLAIFARAHLRIAGCRRIHKYCRSETNFSSHFPYRSGGTTGVRGVAAAEYQI